MSVLGGADPHAWRPVRAQRGTKGGARGRRRLPPLLSGPRRRALRGLIGNGVMQFAGSVALAVAVVNLDLSGPPSALGLAVLCALVAAQMALRTLELSQAERFGQDYVQETRLALLRSILRAREAPDHGVAMTRLVNDLTSLKNWVATGVARSIVAVLSLAGCLAAAMIIDSRLALALAVPIGVTLALVAVMYRPLAARTRAARRARGRMASALGAALLERVSAPQPDADAAMERRLRRVIAKRGARLADALVRRMRCVGLLRAAPEAVAPLLITGLAAFQALDVLPGGLGLLLLAALLAGPVQTLARAAEHHIAFAEARRRLETALNAPRRRRAARAARA